MTFAWMLCTSPKFSSLLKNKNKKSKIKIPNDDERNSDHPKNQTPKSPNFSRKPPEKNPHFSIPLSLLELLFFFLGFVFFSFLSLLSVPGPLCCFFAVLESEDGDRDATWALDPQSVYKEIQKQKQKCLK